MDLNAVISHLILHNFARSSKLEPICNFLLKTDRLYVVEKMILGNE